MIYVNTELVDFGNKKADYKFSKIVQDYHRTIATYKAKYGDVVLYNTAYPARKDTKTGYRRPHKVLSLPYRINLTDPDIGEQKWVYSPASAKKEGDVMMPSEPSLFITQGSLSVSISEKPQLVFFLSKHHWLQKGIISVFDENEVEDKLAREREEAAELNRIVYTKDSPLADEQVLRTVARKWGVGRLDTMKVNAVKNALFNKVHDMETLKKRKQSNTGIAEFLEDMNMGENVVVGEDIQLAIDKGLLTFSKVSNEWLLTVEKGEDPWTITMVSGADTGRAKEVLAEYLTRNKKDAERLSNVISGNAKIQYGQIVDGPPEEDVDEAVLGITIDNVMGEESYALLQKAYTYYTGKSPAGKKKDFIKEELVKCFEEQAQGVT